MPQTPWFSFKNKSNSLAPAQLDGQGNLGVGNGQAFYYNQNIAGNMFRAAINRGRLSRPAWRRPMSASV